MTETFINKSTLQENYSTLPNKLINDEKLSGDGLAVLVYLLSKPADWKVNAQNIANRFGWGIKKVYNIMRHLIQIGYIAKNTKREQGKFAVTLYFVYDSPLSHLPQVVLPQVAERQVVFGNTYKVKKEQSKENILNKERTNDEHEEINNSFTTAISFFKPLGLSDEAARQLFGSLRKHCNQFFEGQSLDQKDEFIFRALKDVSLFNISGKPQAYLQTVLSNKFNEKKEPVKVFTALTKQLTVDEVVTAKPFYQDIINRDGDKTQQVLTMIQNNQIHRDQIRWFYGT
jgi:hypothetical protein